MPRIEKPKSKVKKTIRKITQLTLPTSKTKAVKPRSARSKTSALDYYNCLLTYANQNWQHPLTGEKKKITACCRDCKLNAPALNNQRERELVKLITSYQQVGDSLKKLLRPIK
jgi:hypothetical protein